MHEYLTRFPSNIVSDPLKSLADRIRWAGYCFANVNAPVAIGSIWNVNSDPS
jgi:hypothetical protein